MTNSRAQVAEAAEKEWEEFKAERTAGVEEITHLRERVAEEESRRKTERRAATAADEEQDGDAKMAVEGGEDAQMDVDDGAKKESQETKARESEEKEKEKSGGSKEEKNAKMEVTPTPGADDDDAVEY